MPVHVAAASAAQAVERLGEDARARRLADAAHAGEQEGVRDAVLFDRVRERPRDVLLADQVPKTHRAPLARKDDVAHEVWNQGHPGGLGP